MRYTEYTSCVHMIWEHKHLDSLSVAILMLIIVTVRAVASSPAGLAMAGPVFAAGTKILNIADMHF